MRGTRNSIDSLQRLEEFLSSSFLKSGANHVRDCGRAEIGRLVVGLFLARTMSLSGEIIELIALDLADDAQLPRDPLSNELVSYLVARGQSLNASYVWYVSPYINSQVILWERNPVVVVINTDAMFSKILPLPDDLFSWWITEAGDVESSVFDALYQRRAAAAVSLPHPSFHRLYASVDTELARWAEARAPERPLLLLGDRGSGKTWQLLRFCHDQQLRHKENPWLSPPALYLSLRGISSYLEDTHVSSLGLYALLAQRYSWFEVKWNVTMLQALLESGCLIVCLDGLDEFGVDKSDEGVVDHLKRIVELVPRGSRFVLSCRTTHFSSFAELSGLETWHGSTVAGTMRVLQMLPFEINNLDNYVEAVTSGGSGTSAAKRLRDLVHPTVSDGAIPLALQRCAQEPAILSRLVAELTNNPQKTDLQLLQSALEDSLISFNLEAERTRPIHRAADGSVQAFGTRERVAFLGELSWFMAERNLDSIDLERIPRRIALMFGISSKGLQHDIRSQTVFELDRREADAEVDEPESGDFKCAQVRFGYRFRGADNREGREPKSIDSRLESSMVGLSVANAYFLALHIARRLGDQFTIPGVCPPNTLQYLGRVRLDDLAAAIVRQQLDARAVVGQDAGTLAAAIRALVRQLAGDGSYKVFDRSFRFLVANAVKMGIFSTDEGEELDPWTPEIAAIVSPRMPILDYELVFVPPYPAQWRPPKVANSLPDKNEGRPFLIGLHEVTNQHFNSFIKSPQGQAWAVERIRLSAMEEGTNVRSPKANLTNEYHLYFWVQQHVGGENRYVPPRRYLKHPVVYVSLYSAEAFCEWLSDSNGTPATDPRYRLPSAVEWCWAAQGRYENAKYPWELVPYAVAIPDPPTTNIGADHSLSLDRYDAINWLKSYRTAATDVWLGASKRSSEVGLDNELSPCGVTGLIGNVKEWVGDRIADAQGNGKKWKGIVYGGTAHLGSGSFLFGYNAPLYPENTNPDVGFRIAKSLSPDELRALTLRETELAALKRG